MLSAAEILPRIEDYRVHADGAATFPLYGTMQDADKPFLKGKATAEQVHAEVARRLVASKHMHRTIHTEQQLRKLMAEGEPVALDCSGFVYLVLEGALRRAKQIRYVTYFAKPLVDVRADAARWQQVHHFSDAELAFLDACEQAGRPVPIEWVCQATNRTPQSQISVARLSDESASQAVPFDAMQPGDMLILTAQKRRTHIAVVADVNGRQAQIWDAGGSNLTHVGDQRGGIGSHEVNIDELNGPLEHVRWSTPLDRQFDELELRRPRPLCEPTGQEFMPSYTASVGVVFNTSE